jgi:hypothetical protein
LLEGICPQFHCHVALTGGCLYKDGRRKDADVLFYRIRQQKVIDEVGLIAKLKELGFEIVKRSGWVLKVTYEGKPIDMFFPEEQKIDIHGRCIDDHYPPGPQCPECGKERFEHTDPAYPTVSIWVHSPDVYLPCDGITKTWTDAYVPANHMCPDCHNKLDYDIERLEWYHSLNKVTIKKCEKVWPAGAVGIEFVLKVDPASGTKHCPICEEKLYYNQATDVYQHLDTNINLVASSAPRVMNPNFVGAHIVNQAAVVHGFNTPIDNSTQQSRIKDVTDDY